MFNLAGFFSFYVYKTFSLWVPELRVGRKASPLSSWIICPATGLKKSSTSSGRGMKCRNLQRPFRPLNSGCSWSRETTARCFKERQELQADETFINCRICINNYSNFCHDFFIWNSTTLNFQVSASHESLFDFCTKTKSESRTFVMSAGSVLQIFHVLLKASKLSFFLYVIWVITTVIRSN